MRFQPPIIYKILAIEIATTEIKIDLLRLIKLIDLGNKTYFKIPPAIADKIATPKLKRYQTKIQVF